MSNPHHNQSIRTQRLYVLGSGIFGLTLLMGVARFAYTPLLVVMLQQTSLSDSFGAILASINYAGYLSGALIAASISNMQLKDKLYRLGLIVAIISTALMALSDNIWLWSISRFFAGLSSAAGLLIGSGLIMNWLIRHQFKSELGIHFAGIGIGIALTTFLIEVLKQQLDWQQLWWLLSILACVLVVPAWRWLPKAENSGHTISGQTLIDQPPSKLFLRIFMLAYFLAGAGYVVSATFTVAIVEQLPGQQGLGNWAFIILGIAAAPACIVWDKIAAASSNLIALLLAYLLQVVSIALPLYAESLTGLLIGSALFGFSFIGVVSLVLSMAGRYYPTRPAKMMGKMTLSYGVAQILAPALIALMTNHTSGYQQGLWLALAAMVIGSLLIMLLMKVERMERC